MIPKSLEAITEADLQALIENQVVERKTIEYKRDPPGRGDGDKESLCAHVSSFANSSGGDIILGIDAKNGVPREITGVSLEDLDQEKLRLENALITGIEPRVPFNLGVISVEGGKYVIIIRVRKSWNGPHRVSKTHKFYGRTSSGRYALDVGELRTAFNLSVEVVEKIRDFRAERIAKIYSRETPVPIADGGKFIFHILPLASFTTAFPCDIEPFTKSSEHLPPMYANGWSHRLNLDGLVSYYDIAGKATQAYTQLFRNGVVEAVVDAVRFDQHEVPRVIWGSFEKQLEKILPKYMGLIRSLAFEPPVFLMLSIVNAKGVLPGMGMHSDFWLPNPKQLDRNEAIFPEMVIENFDEPLDGVLEPLFKLAWNAFDLHRPEKAQEANA